MQAGETVKNKLSVITSIKRMCKVYCDKPKMVTFDSDFKTQFEMFPQTNNLILFRLRSFKPGREKVTINCIDNDNKELVQGWTLMVTTIATNHDEVVHFRVGYGRTEPLTPVQFVNRLTQMAVFEVESSVPEVIQVQPDSKVLKVEANSKAFVNLRAVAPAVPGTVEAFIYISETNGGSNECWKVVLEVTA